MFLKETDFKETSIGKTPKEWEVEKLSSIAEIRGNKRINNFDRIAFIPMELVPDSQVFAEYQIRRKEDVKSYTYCEAGDILLAKITPSLENGKQGIVPSDIPNGVAVATTEVFPIHCNEVNTLFLFYILKFPKFRNKIISSMIGTTGRQRASKESVEKLEISLPPLKEQEKIAEVLGVVDLAVAKAGEVIAKTERLKKGLMQELLTKGIGHKEYKQTPIGKTPKEWEIVKLEDVAEIRGNKSISDFEKIAFIPMELIPESEIFAEYQIRAKEDVKSSTYCEADDLLLAKITPSLENGKQGIVPADVPKGIALATTEVFPIRCKAINKFFLFYILKFSKFRNKIISSMIGTTGRQRASKESVERLEIPLPLINEQQRIAEILSNVDKKLGLERNEKAKLERIKLSLMDLLLTGKIRVKVD